MNTTRIGSTTGLAGKASYVRRGTVTWVRTEQAYVDVVNDEERPIVVSAWVGYDCPAKVYLTKGQATELIALLAQAVAG